MSDRVRVREISSDDDNRLLRIVRRDSGSVVTWRRAQIVLLSAQGMDVPRIAEVTFTSPDRVRDVIHNFNTDGFDSLYPRYRGGRPPTFTARQQAEIKRIALGRPTNHGLPFSTWTLPKLAEHLVAPGGGRRHQPRRPAPAAPHGGGVLSTSEDLEDLDRPGLRGEEESDPRAVGDRRRSAAPRPG